MSEVTVKQLYSDVEKLATKQQGRFAEQGLLEAFNTNLADAKAAIPTHDVLTTMPDASGQVRLGDLFVRLGQLMVAMREVTATPQRVVTQLYSDVDKVAKKWPGH